MFDDTKELIQPHIDSFNAFVSSEVLSRIARSIEPIELSLNGSKVSVSLSEIVLSKPFVSEDEISRVDKRLMPWECVAAMKTYKGRIVLRYSVDIYGETFRVDRDAGSIPVMIRSSLCHLVRDGPELHNEGVRCDGNEKGSKNNIMYDGSMGGYFIINGVERVFRFLISHKRNYIFAMKDPSFRKKGFGANLSDYAVMVKSIGDDETAKTNFVHYAEGGGIYFRFYKGRRSILIPLILILKCLDSYSDKYIFEALNYDKNSHLLRKRIEVFITGYYDYVSDVANPIGKLGEIIVKANLFKYRIIDNDESAREFIKLYFLSHLSSNCSKFSFAIECVRRLFKLVDSEVVPDDKENPMNFEVIGELQMMACILKEKISSSMINLYYNISGVLSSSDGTKAAVRDAVLSCVKKPDYTIGDRLVSFFSTGNYTSTGYTGSPDTSGFIIKAERLNYYRFVSHFRAINRGSVFTKMRLASVRKLRPESWGFMCPVHTPDGVSCGLLNHLSYNATVLFKKETLDLEVLCEMGLVMIKMDIILPGHVPVLMDGEVVGCVSDADDFVIKLRRYRMDNNMSFEVAHVPKIYGVENRLYIFTSSGRLSRMVKSDGKVDRIGIFEQVFLKIFPSVPGIHSKKVRDVYEEMEPFSFMSLLAGLIPFMNHNQSPRNMYQCQMLKQSMDMSKAICNDKIYQLMYGQVPIVRTLLHDRFKLDDHPVGINAIVAVMSYTAYDMEDAMIINKGSAERGFFYGTVYKPEYFKVKSGCTIAYTPEIGSVLLPKDDLFRYIDSEGKLQSVKYSGFEGGRVDSVRLFQSSPSSEQADSGIVMLRIERKPNMGDKFCSRHGQKGVCSMRYPMVDLPFSEGGLVPDIIINPHAFPSRMTIGMLIESMAGKVGSLSGKFQDGTPFKNAIDEDYDPVKEFGNELKKYGFNYYGNEPMYSGITGNELYGDIFIGVVYYQRLRHMVNDKYQIRINGPVKPQTRQPLGGRSKLGGVRLGEMERDALIAHGAAYTLQDRLIKCSDGTLFDYCVRCKTLLFMSKRSCMCGGKIIKKVALPFVFKYLCAELLAMNILIRLNVE